MSALDDSKADGCGRHPAARSDGVPEQPGPNNRRRRQTAGALVGMTCPPWSAAAMVAPGRAPCWVR